MISLGQTDNNFYDMAGVGLGLELELGLGLGPGFSIRVSRVSRVMVKVSIRPMARFMVRVSESCRSATRSS